MKYVNVEEYEDDPLREDPQAGVPNIEEESREQLGRISENE